MATPLYDQETQAIGNMVAQVSEKYYGKVNSLENLENLSREIEGRLQDMGFKAFVDYTPCFEGEAIQVRVEERIEKKAFDFERKGHEVRKARKEGKK